MYAIGAAKRKLITVTLIATIGFVAFVQVNKIGFLTVDWRKPSIEILGHAWDFGSHPMIRVLIIPGTNLPSWRSSFVVATREGILDWQSCIERFVIRYGFSYLTKLEVEIFVQGVNASSTDAYDAIFTWTSQLSAGKVAGRTTVVADEFGMTQRAVVVLALTGVVDSSMYTLTDEDMHDIVAEEFGHVLGLGHVDAPNDLMSGYAGLPSKARCHSTLDVYALSVIYAYLQTGIFRRPSQLRVSLADTKIPYLFLLE